MLSIPGSDVQAKIAASTSGSDSTAGIIGGVVVAIVVILAVTVIVVVVLFLRKLFYLIEEQVKWTICLMDLCTFLDTNDMGYATACFL